MTRPVIMFDHDGVLVDSLAVFTAAFAAACRAHGHAEIADPAQVVELFDDNVYDSMAALGMERDVIKAIIDDTAAVLSTSLDLHPFPGVPGLLAGLAARFDVVVITSNAGSVVREFLAREGLGERVSDVLGVGGRLEQGAQDRRRDGALPGPAALLLRRRHPRRHARGR